MTATQLNYALVSYEVQPDGSLMYPWIIDRFVRRDVAKRYADDYNALYTEDSPLIAVVEPA